MRGGVRNRIQSPGKGEAALGHSTVDLRVRVRLASLRLASLPHHVPSAGLVQWPVSHLENREALELRVSWSGEEPQSRECSGWSLGLGGAWRILRYQAHSQRDLGAGCGFALDSFSH